MSKKISTLFNMALCVILAYLGFLWYFGFNIFNWAHWLQLAQLTFDNGRLPVQFFIGWGIILGMLAVLNFIDTLKYVFLTRGQKRDASWANLFSLYKIRPSLFRKKGIVLGLYRTIFGSKRILMSDAPLSTLVAAPAGTGKTTGIVVPSILMSDDASLVINDPKGELFDMTSPYRRSLGPVFKLQWSSSSEETNRWNPLSLENLPGADGEIENYVDRMCSILIDDKKEDFWVANAKILTSTVILFLVFLNRDLEKPITMFDVVSFISELESQSISEDEETKGIKNNLHHAAEFAESQSYPARIKNHLLYLAEIDHRTRSGIIGLVQSKLLIFCNTNVRHVTEKSDFSLKDLRGIEGKPVTVYLCVPALDQQSFGKLTGIFIESATQILTLDAKNTKIPVRMILDEVAFLPPINSISVGPAITRGYNISFMNVCQDYAQIRDKWGAGALDNLITNSAFKIVLAQNNVETSDKISKLIGTRTRRRKNVSVADGKNKSRSTSMSEEVVPLILPQEISNLKFGKQILLVQGFLNRPIMCTSPHYWKFSCFRKKMSSTKKQTI